MVETVPEGKIIIDPPLDKCSLDFFLVSKLVIKACLSPVKSIGKR